MYLFNIYGTFKKIVSVFILFILICVYIIYFNLGFFLLMFVNPPFLSYCEAHCVTSLYEMRRTNKV